MTELIIIGVLGTGIALATWKEMELFYSQCGKKARDWMKGFKSDVNTDIAKVANEGSNKKPGSEHIRLLLQITLGMGTERSMKAFCLLTTVPCAAVFLYLIDKIPLLLVVGAAAMTASMPYGLLRLRLQRLRIESSREGEILLTELLNNYKICYLNMQRAIEETAKTMEDAPNCRRLLFNLSKGLNTAGTSSRINRLLREFRLSLNTSWGNILTDNMYFALVSGMEVTEALSDLTENIKKARKVDEYARRENNEAGLMLKYLAPLSYFMTVVGGIWFFGLTPEKFLFYQFRTEVGLTWFTISAVIYGTGLLANGYLTKTKLDL
ncbi:MAG: hypothetical protein IKW01_02740 [Firmicutes bacterium]|nr:hypothetical protein [Bacillota bacterium]